MDGDATIEVALDLGKVVAADREARLCEIEFEKEAGSPTALFVLARKVDQLTPAHLGVLSKAERGYRLLGATPGVVKAVPTSLGLFAAAFQNQIDRLRCQRQAIDIAPLVDLAERRPGSRFPLSRA